MDPTEKDIYNPKKDIGSAVRFMNGLLDRASNFAQHIDAQTNIILGLSSAIFIFSASRLQTSQDNHFFLVLCAFAAISALVSLYAIHPPKFLRKRGQKESLMYNKKITSFSTPSKYSNSLCKIIGNRDLVISEYAVEIYNLYKFYYRPKRKLFRIARDILITGIFLSLLTLLLNI